MINWLVIGIGDITRKRVLPAILEDPRSHLRAILTRDPAKADAYPGAQSYTALADALRDPRIDAVYVASPVALHAQQTIASLHAGKHVLCEKPTAMNFAEAESMVEAAEETRRLFAVAFYRRLFPKLLRAKALLDTCAIGQPTLLYATSHGWIETGERAWLHNPALAGGGPLFDIGSHRIDAANFLFGQPTAATGLLSNVVHHLAVEDSATAVIDYASQARAIIDVRWNSRIPRDEFRIFGTDGELDLSPLGSPTLRIHTAAGTAEEHLPTAANVHLPLIQNFTAAILDGASLICPGAEAIQTDWVTGQVVEHHTKAR